MNTRRFEQFAHPQVAPPLRLDCVTCDDILAYAKRGSAKLLRELGNQVVDHPLPLTLIGVGLALPTTRRPVPRPISPRRSDLMTPRTGAVARGIRKRTGPRIPHCRPLPWKRCAELRSVAEDRRTFLHDRFEQTWVQAKRVQDRRCNLRCVCHRAHLFGADLGR